MSENESKQDDGKRYPKRPDMKEIRRRFICANACNFCIWSDEYENFKRHAPTDIAALLAYVERLETDLNELCPIADYPVTVSLRAELAHANEEYEKALDTMRIKHDAAIAKENEWKKAIEGLTPGGSEFVNDPKRCAEYIREITRWPKQIIEARKERDTALARAEAAESEIAETRVCLRQIDGRDLPLTLVELAKSAAGMMRDAEARAKSEWEADFEGSYGRAVDAIHKRLEAALGHELTPLDEHCGAFGELHQVLLGIIELEERESEYAELAGLSWCEECKQWKEDVSEDNETGFHFCLDCYDAWPYECENCNWRTGHPEEFENTCPACGGELELRPPKEDAK